MLSANSAPYLIPFLLSAMLSFGLAFYAANFIRMPGAIPFMLLTVVQSAWTVSMILEIVSPSLPEKQFWDSVQWALTFGCTFAVYWFTQDILPAKHRAKIPRWLLFLFPTLFMILLITNPGTVYQNESIVRGLPLDKHQFSFTMLDWIAFGYMYTILIFTNYWLFWKRRAATGQARHQLTWVLFGVFVQTAMYCILFVAGVSILGQPDTAPFTFLVGNLILGWGLFKYGFFELGPMARSQVVENLADAFIVTDVSGRIVDMNAIARSFAPPNWNQGSIAEVFSEWSIEIESERFGTPFTEEYPYDEWHHLFTRIEGDAALGCPARHCRLLVIVRDISQRKLLETALAASEARYRSIIGSMAEGVILHDESGIIITCNHAAELILGIPCEKLHGKSLVAVSQHLAMMREDGSLLPEDTIPGRTALETGQPLRDIVIGIKPPTGDMKWLLINVQPFVYSEGGTTQTKQVIISFRDVTDLRRMQAEAMRAEIAQERAHLLARFVQSASHEFRTPLAIIGTSLYLMARQPDPTKRQSHSEVAEREIKRIEVLLEMFVNMVQLDTGVSLERIPTQIDLLVRCSMVKFEKAAFDHHINLQLNVSSPLPRIQIDPYYLTMALEQILDNGVRYTPDGGSIDIEVTAEDKWLVINVRDSGLGIADDELEHIFDRFWRHDKAHSTPGFGLGLSIVQKVIEQHQGTINIKSKVGQGTTVTLRLPV